MEDSTRAERTLPATSQVDLGSVAAEPVEGSIRAERTFPATSQVDLLVTLAGERNSRTNVAKGRNLLDMEQQYEAPGFVSDFERRRRERRPWSTAVGVVIAIVLCSLVVWYGMPSHDAKIKSKIEEALQHSAGLDASHITVMVKGSKVTLIGTVRSLDEKVHAWRVASSVIGVYPTYEVENWLDGPWLLRPIIPVPQW